MSALWVGIIVCATSGGCGAYSHDYISHEGEAQKGYFSEAQCVEESAQLARYFEIKFNYAFDFKCVTFESLQLHTPVQKQ